MHRAQIYYQFQVGQTQPHLINNHGPHHLSPTPSTQVQGYAGANQNKATLSSWSCRKSSEIIIFIFAPYYVHNMSTCPCGLELRKSFKFGAAVVMQQLFRKPRYQLMYLVILDMYV